MDFLYRGEANIYQENLDSFLAMADELQLKGFNERDKEVEKKQRLYNITSDTIKDETMLQGFKSEVATRVKAETTIALDNFTGKTDLQELDTKVKLMMTSSENRIGKEQKKGKICNVCGKEGDRNNIKNHIEANHLTNISIPCNSCDKILHTRSALNQHNRAYHS